LDIPKQTPRHWLSGWNWWLDYLIPFGVPVELLHEAETPKTKTDMALCVSCS